MALIKLETIGAEPINLTQCKNFLRINHDLDDELIERLISAARVLIEGYTSRSLIQQKWQFTINAGFVMAKSMDNCLSKGAVNPKGIEIPRAPFVKLCGNPTIKCAQKEQEITNFHIDEVGRSSYIYLDSNCSNFYSTNGILKISFIAGYAEDDIPEPLRQSLYMILAHMYEKKVIANDSHGLISELNEGILTLIRPYQIRRIR